MSDSSDNSPEDSPDDGPFSRIGEDVDGLLEDAREFADARYQLAQLEVQQSVGAIKRVVIGSAAAGVMALVALPTMLVLLAELLATWTTWEPEIWLAILGCGLLVSAAAVFVMSRRRFQREFVGLQDTLAELKEDVVWLRELAGGSQKAEEDTEMTND